MAGRSQQRRESRARVDQPRTPRRGPALPEYDPESFGRFAERFARFMGTSKFLVYMTGLVVIWVSYNAVVGVHYYHTHHGCGITTIQGDRIVQATRNIARCRNGLKPFDPYPFILLNLFFSTQASYAAPLILLAQNRQADRDRVSLDEDRARNERSIADTEYLTREVASIRIALGEVATRDFIRGELQRMLEELEEQHERRADETEPA